MSDEARLWVVGLGTVGQWLIRALDMHRESLSRRHGFTPTVVGLANARDGFIHDANGLDLATLLDLVSAGRPITEQPGAEHWPNALDGLQATEADVLVEVTSSPPEDGEPGRAHMFEALRRGISVVTSNKWPVALHGVELAALARRERAAFRAESTVMSGTPVLAALVDGLAGATPVRLRGILNATANFILTAMENGRTYEEALQEAQAAGLAERDPSADVDGHDSTAKTMILAALVFGQQLRREDVFLRGIAGIDRAEVEAAKSADGRIRLVSTLERSGGAVSSRVEPELVQGADPLARIDGVMNAVVVEAEPVGQIMISGPGAGLALAGQGVLSDLISVGRRRAHARA